MTVVSRISVFPPRRPCQEQAVTPGTVKRGSYTVVVVPASTQLVLRYGTSVVGVENDGSGRIPLTNSDTVSPSVTLEAK